MTDLMADDTFEPDYGDNDELDNKTKIDVADNVESDDGEIKSDAEDGELSGSDDSDGEICEPSTQSVSIFADVKPKKQKPPEIQHETPLRELPEWLAAKRRIPCKYFKAGYCQFGGKCHYFHDRPDQVSSRNASNNQKSHSDTHALDRAG